MLTGTFRNLKGKFNKGGTFEKRLKKTCEPWCKPGGSYVKTQRRDQKKKKSNREGFEGSHLLEEIWKVCQRMGTAKEKKTLTPKWVPKITVQQGGGLEKLKKRRTPGEESGFHKMTGRRLSTRRRKSEVKGEGKREKHEFTKKPKRGMMFNQKFRKAHATRIEGGLCGAKKRHPDKKKKTGRKQGGAPKRAGKTRGGVEKNWGHKATLSTMPKGWKQKPGY